MTIEEELKAREIAKNNKNKADDMKRTVAEAFKSQGSDVNYPELIIPTGELKKIIDETIPVVFSAEYTLCDGFFKLAKVKIGNRIVTRPVLYRQSKKDEDTSKIRYFSFEYTTNRESMEEYSRSKTVYILENGLLGYGVISFKSGDHRLYDSTLELVKAFENDIYEAKWFRDSLLHAIERRMEMEDRKKRLEKRNKGCYIATSVYGSYNCPQVWALRRYRDNYLAQSVCGRTFIRCYYAISPTLVKLFGKQEWFQTLWKGYLDKKVRLLKRRGYEDTPYNDLNW